MSAASAAAAAAARAMETALGRDPEPVQKSGFLERIQRIYSLALDLLARASSQVFSFFRYCGNVMLSTLSTFGTQDPNYPPVKI